MTTTKKTLLLAIVVLLGVAALAADFPRAEVQVDYAYTRFVPNATYAPHLNLNGGGGAFIFNINHLIGIEAELVGSASSKATWTIPKGNTIVPNGATVSVSGNLFTYLFGPRINIPVKKINPYFDFLFGGAHTSAYGNAFNAVNKASAAPSGNAFGMAIGGGLDLPVSKTISVKLGQFDYLMTRFNNGFTSTKNENNFRYQAGIVFRFAKHSL